MGTALGSFLTSPVTPQPGMDLSAELFIFRLHCGLYHPVMP